MLSDGGNGSDAMTLRRSRSEWLLRVERLGQTTASLLWIGSIVIYGINAPGDWLQLCAASAWLLANIVALGTTKAD